MSSASMATVDVHVSNDDWLAHLADQCRAGLAADPKWLSPVWFYDQRGSELFDEITRLPEYYPTRAERSLLLTHADEIVALAGASTLVELGSGTSDKTRCLLDAMTRAELAGSYVPFDVSEETVREAADVLLGEYPGLSVHAVVGDFLRHLSTIPRGDGHRLVAFLGGTIGNLDPGTRAKFLFDLDCAMDADDHLLLGVDLVKDPEVLVAAYDDAAGVTAAFNQNALRHLNARFDATFDPLAFDHVARWNPHDAWIEMHLRSERDQRVEVAGLDLSLTFRAGELMRTEISAKFTPDGLTAELWEAGFVVDATWTAEPGFLLVLAHPYC